MKKIINLVLSIFSPFASVPTGWAIYAGVTNKPAFPMNPWAAGIGSVAIITTSIAAGLLVVDIYSYNQGMKNKTEREELSISPRSAWLVLGLCVLAEIALSLLIVVIPSLLAYGVLAFPIMTLAGVFAFATRYDLQQREVNREQLRAERRKAKNEAAQQPQEVRSAKRKSAQKSLSEIVCRYAGAGCDRTFASQNAANAHARTCGFKPTVSMPVDVSMKR